MELAFVFMNDAVKVEIEPEQVTAEKVEHILYHVGQDEKFPTLFGLLKSAKVQSRRVRAHVHGSSRCRLSSPFSAISCLKPLVEAISCLKPALRRQTRAPSA